MCNPYMDPYGNYYRNFGNYGNYQQPQQPQPQPQMQQYSGFQWVRGEAAAKAFRADPGQTVLLMDSDEPVLYVNSTDMSGKPAPMITYDLVERVAAQVKQETPSIDFSEYVKKVDVEEYIKSCVAKAVNDRMSDLHFTASTGSKKEA